jgi:serine protease Do
VDEAKADSPAAKAGVQPGDVITATDGSLIKDSRGLARNIGALAPNTSVKLYILRKGEPKTLTVPLAKMPNEKQANAESPATPPNESSHLGLSVKPARDIAGMGTNGVVVTAVDPSGPAAQQGIAAGDVILDVGGKTVANANDVRKAMDQAKAEHKHDVLMRVKSAKAILFVAVPIGKG